jgi:hypothetical protein
VGNRPRGEVFPDPWSAGKPTARCRIGGEQSAFDFLAENNGMNYIKRSPPAQESLGLSSKEAVVAFAPAIALQTHVTRRRRAATNGGNGLGKLVE